MKSKPLSPLKMDPTRTMTIRRQWTNDFKKRFNQLKKDIVDLVVTQDVFGLNQQNPYTVNASFQFHSLPEQIKAFQGWLKQRVSILLLAGSDTASSWWKKYIVDGFRKGQGRVFDDYKKVDPNSQHYQFLKQAFNNPVSQEKVDVLAARVFSELEGVTDAMGQQITRVLTDGLTQGKNPKEIAKDLTEKVDGIGANRARMISQTEVIRSFSEGQLDELERMGVAEVGIQVEFSAAHKGACPICQALNGKRYTLAKARGVIPVHVCCRCCFRPVLATDKTPDEPKPVENTVLGAEGVKNDRSVFNRVYNWLIDNFNPYRDEKGRYTTKANAHNWHEPTYTKLESGKHLVSVSHDNQTTQMEMKRALNRANSPKTAENVNRVRSLLSKHNKELEGVRQDFLREVTKTEKEIDKHKTNFEKLLKEAAPHFQVNPKKHQQIEKRAMTAYKKLSEARVKLELSEGKGREQLVKAMKIKDPAQVTVYHAEGSRVIPSVTDKSKTASEFLGSIMSQTVVAKHDVDMHVIREYRSYADKNNFGNHEIHMNIGASTVTHVHELGHTVEFTSPKLQEASQGFIHHRTEGEKPHHYPTGGPDEVGFKNEFSKAFDSPHHDIYIGKHYGSGHTEVLAMGFQKLYENPIHFAKHDPEYFKFVVGALKGKFSE